jgi:hypothetical protein
MVNRDDIQNTPCTGAANQYIALAKIQTRQTLANFGLDIDAMLSEKTSGEEVGDNVDQRGLLRQLDDMVGGILDLTPAAGSETEDGAIAKLYDDAASATEAAANLTSALTGYDQISAQTYADFGDMGSAIRTFGTGGAESLGVNSGFGNEIKLGRPVSPTAKKTHVGNACAANSYTGTVSQVIQNASGVFRNTKELLTGKVQSGFGSLAQQTGEFIDGVFAEGINTLVNYFDLEIVILEQIEKLVKSLNKDIEKLEMQNLLLEHQQLIKAAQRDMIRSQAAYQSVLRRLEGGLGFSKSLYEDGLSLIGEAKDKFKGSDFDIRLPDLRIFEIQAKLQLLGVLRSAWLRRVSNRERVGGNAMKFREVIQTADLGSLTTPFIDLILCRLQYLIFQTQNALENRGLSPIQLFGKEKVWYVGLLTLELTAKSLKDGLRWATQLQDFQINETLEFELKFRSRESVILSNKQFSQNLDSYIDLVGRVLRNDLTAKATAPTKGAALIEVSAGRRKKLEDQTTMFDDFLGSDAIKVLKATSGAAQFIGMVQGVGDGLLGDMLKEMDLEGLFNADGVSNSLVAQEWEALGKMGDCLTESGEEQDLNALALTQTLESTALFKTSSEDHYEAFFGDLPEQALDEQNRIKERQARVEEYYGNKQEIAQDSPPITGKLGSRVSDQDGDLLAGYNDSLFEVDDTLVFGDPELADAKVTITSENLGLPKAITENNLFYPGGDEAQKIAEADWYDPKEGTPYWWPADFGFPLKPVTTLKTLAGFGRGPQEEKIMDEAKAQIRASARFKIQQRAIAEFGIKMCYKPTQKQLNEIVKLVDSIIQF